MAEVTGGVQVRRHVRRHTERTMGTSRLTPHQRADVVRRYPHPGKYEGELIFAPYIHQMSLEGFGGEETGDVATFGYFVKMNLRGDLRHVYKIAQDDKTPLTPAEKKFLFENPYVIVGENEQGFVTIEYYGDKGQWQRNWDAIEDRVARFEEG